MKAIIILLFAFSFVYNINSQSLKKNEIELINRLATEKELINEKSVNMLKRFRNNKTTIWVKLFKSGEDMFGKKNLSLNFFEDGKLTAKHVKTEKVNEKEYLWTGTIGETGVISIYNNNGKLTGTVITKTNEYRIEPLDNKTHALIKINNKCVLSKVISMKRKMLKNKFINIVYTKKIKAKKNYIKFEVLLCSVI